MTQGPRPIRRSSNPTPIGAALAGVLKRAGLDDRMAERPALDAYLRAVGPAVARLAQPVRVRRGVLDVAVASAPLLHELAHFRARDIVDRIRRAVPGTTIRSLRFRLAASRA